MNEYTTQPVANTPQVPAQPVVANEVAASAPAAMPQASAGSKVLLVEDDPFLNSLLKTKLASQGINVTLVTDGQAALDTMSKMTPDLVLLDLILPKRSGFEVLEAMQADPSLSQVPVIILSNLGQDSDVSKGQQLGAVEYFIKAKTSIDDLVLRIKGFLQSK